MKHTLPLFINKLTSSYYQSLIQMYLDYKTYTVSPFMNISCLSLIKLVRTQESKSFMINWESMKKMLEKWKNVPMFHNKINIYSCILYLGFTILLLNIDIMNLLRVTKKFQPPTVCFSNFIRSHKDLRF